MADAKLGNSIKDKLELDCVHNSKIGDLMQCIRSQISGLISGGCSGLDMLVKGLTIPVLHTAENSISKEN